MFDATELPQERCGGAVGVDRTLPRMAEARRAPVQMSLLSPTELPLTVITESTEQNYGEIFTRRWVVELILDLVEYTSDRDLCHVTALEPACGTGAFLVPMVERLSDSLNRHGRSLEEARDAIRAHDLLAPNVVEARAKIVDVLVANGWARPASVAASEGWVTQADFLLRERVARDVDVVVGNPPYIRLEDVPEARSKAYRAACPTMGGRADIFVGFYEMGLRSLKRDGKLGFICADRWMRNAYGKGLRALVASRYAVDAAIVMHDVDAFEEQVSAYPAVTILRAGRQGAALIADTTSEFTAAGAGELVRWYQSGNVDPLHCGGLSAAWLPHWFTTAAGWPTGSPERLALVAALEERFPLMEEAGCKVGIGIASGADDVYVVKDAGVVEAERMLPMVMRADLRSGSIEYSGHYLVNPWSREGLVALEDWPRLGDYLGKHWSALAKRSVAKRSPGREHRTIDRVIEGLAGRPKLLLADMSERIWPVLDRGTFYPHHNLYWITSSEWDLEVLGGLLLSDVAELFISTYCVRMRGGTLRFQAQYLRRIRLPRFSDIGVEDRERLREAFESRDSAAATAVALRLYEVEALPM